MQHPSTLLYAGTSLFFQRGCVGKVPLCKKENRSQELDLKGKFSILHINESIWYFFKVKL